MKDTYLIIRKNNDVDFLLVTKEGLKEVSFADNLDLCQKVMQEFVPQNTKNKPTKAIHNNALKIQIEATKRPKSICYDYKLLHMDSVAVEFLADGSPIFSNVVTLFPKASVAYAQSRLKASSPPFVPSGNDQGRFDDNVQESKKTSKIGRFTAS